MWSLLRSCAECVALSARLCLCGPAAKYIPPASIVIHPRCPEARVFRCAGLTSAGLAALRAVAIEKAQRRLHPSSPPIFWLTNARPSSLAFESFARSVCCPDNSSHPPTNACRRSSISAGEGAWIHVTRNHPLILRSTSLTSRASTTVPNGPCAV